MPDTGEQSHVGLWILLTAVSAMSLCTLIVIRRRKSKSR